MTTDLTHCPGCGKKLVGYTHEGDGRYTRECDCGKYEQRQLDYRTLNPGDTIDNACPQAGCGEVRVLKVDRGPVYKYICRKCRGQVNAKLTRF